MNESTVSTVAVAPTQQNPEPTPCRDTASLDTVVVWESYNPTGAGTMAVCPSASTPSQWEKAPDHGEQVRGTDEGVWSTCSGVPGGLPLRKLLRKSMALGKMGYGEPKGQSLFPPPSYKDRGRE